MAKRIALLLALVFGLSLVPLQSFAETKNQEEIQEKDETPQWAKDLRRTEIISFGTLPFVTIGTTLVYGGVLYGQGKVSSFPNPLDKGSSAFSTEQQVQILVTSVGISLGLGLIDLGINHIKRRNARARTESENVQEHIRNITPEEAGVLMKRANAVDRDYVDPEENPTHEENPEVADSEEQNGNSKKDGE